MSWYKNYKGIIWLLTGIVAGSIAGLLMGNGVTILKPIGDLFLNLLFTAVIPLVFFAIASAIAGLDNSRKLSRVMGVMTMVFLATVLISAMLTIAAVWLFPVHEHLSASHLAEIPTKNNLGEQLTSLFTTSEFYMLLSRRNMLALIVFSLFTGFATLQSGGREQPLLVF